VGPPLKRPGRPTDTPNANPLLVQVDREGFIVAPRGSLGMPGGGVWPSARRKAVVRVSWSHACGGRKNRRFRVGLVNRLRRAGGVDEWRRGAPVTGCPSICLGTTKIACPA